MSSIIMPASKVNIFVALFKIAATILLIFSFAVQTFRGGFVMINYYTNTAVFAKKCINKAKPKLHCNGKCQMMKQMQEEEENDRQAPERKLDYKIEVLSSRSFFNSAATNFSVIISHLFPVRKSCPSTDISYGFFHPPQA